MSDKETEGWMSAIARAGAESRRQSDQPSSLAPVAGSAPTPRSYWRARNEPNTAVSQLRDKATNE
jgi:hypothetical protein